MTIYSDGKVLWTTKQQLGWRFRLYCWLAFQRWFQVVIIPYHVVQGIRYGYSAKEIYRFCLCSIKGNGRPEEIKAK